ncbi:hypothetical protein Q9Q95_18620 [Sphingomonas sp. DG1-23]|uniref:hypothetical protein n=1 Tax=Sphingomonas sp. DG1-23 TaxID=3068316 RepID=UPI00273DD058|nr:hypothetical protein [Sphingomonas sp. DG1-23]MDP5280945.1 hypothetical protein [Sphingomonas sp. DG1-23]
MKMMRVIGAGLTAFAAAPALACLPPPPGTPTPPPPGEPQLAELTFRGAREIVEGVVIAVRADASARFEIRHVYKGTLRRGAVLDVRYHAPMPCGAPTPPPPRKGGHGVLAFTTEPQIDFVPAALVDRMIADKWIAPGPRDRRPQRVGTGSAPE